MRQSVPVTFLPQEDKYLNLPPSVNGPGRGGESTSNHIISHLHCHGIPLQFTICRERKTSHSTGYQITSSAQFAPWSHPGVLGHRILTCGFMRTQLSPEQLSMLMA